MPDGRPETASRRGFRPLARGDRVYLIVVIAFAVLAFLPWSRELQLGPMALLGWLMAALMVLSPVIALTRLRAQRRSRDNAPSAEPENRR